MFKGKMLVYEGGTGRNTVEVENAATQFFQIRGVDENSTKAIEVMPVAASLNSNDVFMLNSKQFGSFLWFGRGCSGDERELGRQVAKHITGSSDTETVVEGQEPPEFWAAIGGKTEYSSGKQFEVRYSSLYGFLYQLWIAIPVRSFDMVHHMGIRPEILTKYLSLK